MENYDNKICELFELFKDDLGEPAERSLEPDINDLILKNTTSEQDQAYLCSLLGISIDDFDGFFALKNCSEGTVEVHSWGTYAGYKTEVELLVKHDQFESIILTFDNRFPEQVSLLLTLNTVFFTEVTIKIHQIPNIMRGYFELLQLCTMVKNRCFRSERLATFLRETAS